MKLISIDPGLKTSNTGVAVFDESRLIYNGVYQVEKLSWSGNMHKLVRYLKPFCHEADIVVVEKSYYPGKANWMHLKTLGVLDYFFNIKTIAPASVKKLVALSGRATKQEVKNAVIKTLSEEEVKLIKIDSEDAVDAIAIGLAYLKKENASV